MQELATRKARATISEVKLDLQSTDIPSDALPTGERGERLLLPTLSRLRLAGDGLGIEMIVQDPETWGNQFYEQPSFDDENPPIITLNIYKDEILRLIVGDCTYRGHPLAVLVISDPGEVVDSLRLTFASTDPYNADYAIKALVKMLRDRLGVTIEEIQQEPRPPQDDLDIPF
jgi:hypothetical protein